MADRERLAQAAQLDAAAARHLLDLQLEGIREAPLGVVVCCDRRAPAAGVLGRATFPDADLWSCACAIENLWLAARAEGLGMGWVTLFAPAELSALLGLPDGVVTLGWLCLGWPDERPPEPGLQRAGWSRRDPDAAPTWCSPSRWPAADVPRHRPAPGVAAAGARAAAGRRRPGPGRRPADPARLARRPRSSRRPGHGARPGAPDRRHPRPGRRPPPGGRARGQRLRPVGHRRRAGRRPGGGGPRGGAPRPPPGWRSTSSIAGTSDRATCATPTPSTSRRSHELVEVGRGRGRAAAGRPVWSPWARSAWPTRSSPPPSPPPCSASVPPTRSAWGRASDTAMLERQARWWSTPPCAGSRRPRVARRRRSGRPGGAGRTRVRGAGRGHARRRGGRGGRGPRRAGHVGGGAGRRPASSPGSPPTWSPASAAGNWRTRGADPARAGTVAGPAPARR